MCHHCPSDSNIMSNGSSAWVGYQIYPAKEVVRKKEAQYGCHARESQCPGLLLQGWTDLFYFNDSDVSVVQRDVRKRKSSFSKAAMHVGL